MSKPLKPVWGLFFILLGFVGVVLVMKALRPKEIVQWRTDFAAAAEESRSTGKPILAYFTADWCAPCQDLKHTTWADKRVAEALRTNFLAVKIDFDREEELVRRYGVEGIPAYALLAPGGEQLKHFEGALPPDDFLTWLKQ